LPGNSFSGQLPIRRPKVVEKGDWQSPDSAGDWSSGLFCASFMDSTLLPSPSTGEPGGHDRAADNLEELPPFHGAHSY
jgi:hypothetical protein